MLSMMKKTFLPSVLSYCKELAETAAKTKAILPDAPISAESKLLEKLSSLYTEISEKTEALAEAEKRQNPWKIISRRLHISTIRFLPRWMT